MKNLILWCSIQVIKLDLQMDKEYWGELSKSKVESKLTESEEIYKGLDVWSTYNAGVSSRFDQLQLFKILNRVQWEASHEGCYYNWYHYSRKASQNLSSFWGG